MGVEHLSYLLVEHIEGKATWNETKDFLSEGGFQMYTREKNCGVSVNNWDLVDKNLFCVCLFINKPSLNFIFRLI